MSKVYFYKEFGGFAAGFVPQNSEDVWKNCAPRQKMCYIDPDKPGGRAALTVRSMYDTLRKTPPYTQTILKFKGLYVKDEISEERSPDGRYSARLEIGIGKLEHGFLGKEFGKIKVFSTKSGYNKEITCDPEIIRYINDFVEELESMANPDKLLDEIAFNGGF